LVFHSSTITMMHGPINIRLRIWNSLDLQPQGIHHLVQKVSRL